MRDRVEVLERRVRLLSMALVAGVAFGLGALWGRGPAPSELRFLPQAEAGDMESYKATSERPALFFVPSDSGATLYEYRLQEDGSYKKLVW